MVIAACSGVGRVLMPDADGKSRPRPMPRAISPLRSSCSSSSTEATQRGGSVRGVGLAAFEDDGSLYAQAVTAPSASRKNRDMCYGKSELLRMESCGRPRSRGESMGRSCLL